MDVNKTLLQKYYQGLCNEEEERIVEEWLQQSDDFAGTGSAADQPDAKARMWQVIRNNTIGEHMLLMRYRGLYAVAAGLLLVLVTGILFWSRQNNLPAESEYVIIDNTRSKLLTQQRMGDLVLSESANSGLKYDTARMLFSNYLIINNQKGEDVWVYLKTSSEKGSSMRKFLCKGKKTYVAGYITEYTQTGKRKYLYSKDSGLPKEIAGGIKSQLNAAQVNARYMGNTAIII